MLTAHGLDFLWDWNCVHFLSTPWNNSCDWKTDTNIIFLSVLFSVNDFVYYGVDN